MREGGVIPHHGTALFPARRKLRDERSSPPLRSAHNSRKDTMDSTSDIARQLGSLGGQKTKEKYGVDHYKKISLKGVEARNKNRAKKKSKL